MTTATKTKNTVKKRMGEDSVLPPLPPAADVAKISGTEYLVMPLEQYYEWYEDHALAAIAADRLKRQEHLAVPFAEILKSQDRKRAKKRTPCAGYCRRRARQNLSVGKETSEKVER